uniref:Ephrin RBD domain-containing protein n=1 Tax=Parascaris univalens TaxID=6257 RepID=A0A915AWG4_PARUN
MKMKITLAILLVYCEIFESRRNHRGKLEIDSFSIHHLYWNSSNSIFDIFTNSIQSDYSHGDAAPVLSVRLLDTLTIHCPLYTTKEFEDLAERSLVYMVSKYGFERCILDHTARLIAQCNSTPTSRSVVHRVFRRRGGAFGKLIPGQDYFLISTSTGTLDGLYKSHGGLCAEKNMRIKIHIEKENFEKADPIKIHPIYFADDDNTDRKMNELDNANDEVFMTEEFNELTWKKKIVDPRVPESEKQFGGKIIYSLPLGAAQREFLKFSRTRQVDRPISVEKFDDTLIPMMRVLDSGELDAAAWTHSRSGRSRRRRPLSEDNNNAVLDKFSDEQWMLIRDNDSQPGEQLEFTKTEETAPNANDKDTAEMMHVIDETLLHQMQPPAYHTGNHITLTFYDRPSGVVRSFSNSASPTSILLMASLILLIFHRL